MNAFTVDVEDYFQVSGFERQIDRRDWDGFESRVVPSTRRILALLEDRNVRGTFFVLGWVAHKFPGLVREIQAAGHELASHSYWHRLIYSLTPEEFRQDLRDSKAAIEDAAGAAVTAFRAPSFSITSKSLWAFEILVEEGFTTDSSVFPIAHDRYGIPGCKPDIHHIDTPAGRIVEFPMTALGIRRFSLPVGGGGYFRLYPYWFTKSLLRQVNGRAKRPFAFYIHPWEVDPDQPRLRFGSGLSRFRHYVNLQPTMAKLSKLLTSFRFGTLSESIARYEGVDRFLDTTSAAEILRRPETAWRRTTSATDKPA
jgi:polysaccharide deacetylase family protein (PEP-CTERM system associated)